MIKAMVVEPRCAFDVQKAGVVGIPGRRSRQYREIREVDDVASSLTVGRCPVPPRIALTARSHNSLGVRPRIGVVGTVRCQVSFVLVS